LTFTVPYTNPYMHITRTKVTASNGEAGWRSAVSVYLSIAISSRMFDTCSGDKYLSFRNKFLYMSVSNKGDLVVKKKKGLVFASINTFCASVHKIWTIFFVLTRTLLSELTHICFLRTMWRFTMFCLFVECCVLYVFKFLYACHNVSVRVRISATL